MEIKRIYQILEQHYFQEIIKKIGISLQLLLNLEIIYYLGYFIFAILALKKVFDQKVKATTEATIQCHS